MKKYVSGSAGSGLRRRHSRIWRASVVGTTIYVFLFTITLIWILHTSNSGQYPSQILGTHYGGLSLYQIVSFVNIAWFIALVADLIVLMRRSPRKGILGPLCGVVSSIIAIAVVQWAVEGMKRVAEAWVLQ
ncbi:MAG: hypothetical protein OXN17_16265 [Candidatus Poribacteria bacterium]|nr:hypothetical protein [Candidatus Poribacteria bacterium]MDE0505338.1 hypothetical protein [Candidatus Poribacteria bacterium]